MLDEKKIREALENVSKYLEEGLLKKQRNETAKEMYIANSEASLETAQRLFVMETENYKPYLWVIVASYYSMFYISNAVLMDIGYKIGEKICHKVTEDCLIAFVRDRLKKNMLEEYEEAKADALQLIASQADSLIESYSYEREKRSVFQYRMDEFLKKAKAETSLNRAKKFVFEMKKLLKP